MSAEVLSPTPQNILKAKQQLLAGNVVAMPTETVYGLAACVFNEQALAKVFSVKERPRFDPLIVHVGRMPPKMEPVDHLESLDLIQSDRFEAPAVQKLNLLLLNFWPGPLTVVLPKNQKVPDLATSGLPTVAVRMPSHPVAQTLISEVGQPLAAPSANRFGKISPTSASHVFDELGDRIELILDGGPCTVGLESTVILYEPNGNVTLLRPGAITQQELEAFLGISVSVAQQKSTVNAPGMLESHYAPTKTLLLLPQALDLLTDLELNQTLNATIPASVTALGLLFFQNNGRIPIQRLRIEESLPGKKVEIIEVLSASGHLTEAARNLFSSLRSLDASQAEFLVAEPPPNRVGLGHAIYDRLSRASHLKPNILRSK